jgi:hypothetical protein
MGWEMIWVIFKIFNQKAVWGDLGTIKQGESSAGWKNKKRDYI